MADAMRPGDGLLHAGRASTLLASAVGIAVAMHAASDGCVDVTSTILATVLCLPSAVVLTRREPSLPALLAWLAGVQVGVHLVLTALCGGPVVAGPKVLLAHFAAVLMTALLLRRTDAVLWAAAAVRRAAQYVLTLLRPVLGLVLYRRPRRRGRTARLSARTGWRCPSPVRRGPPAEALAS